MNTRSLSALFIGWLVPGLGHVYLKKFWRGGIFFVCIAAMAAIGLFMGGRVYSFQDERLTLRLFFKVITENPLTLLAFFSDMGNFLFYLFSKLFSFGLGNLKNTTFEFGTTYIAGAGLLNYLVALDAFDIASGKKG
jgi:hypothetical protein